MSTTFRACQFERHHVKCGLRILVFVVSIASLSICLGDANAQCDRPVIIRSVINGNDFTVAVEQREGVRQLDTGESEFFQYVVTVKSQLSSLTLSIPRFEWHEVLQLHSVRSDLQLSKSQVESVDDLVSAGFDLYQAVGNGPADHPGVMKKTTELGQRLRVILSAKQRERLEQILFRWAIRECGFADVLSWKPFAQEFEVTEAQMMRLSRIPRLERTSETTILKDPKAAVKQLTKVLTKNQRAQLNQYFEQHGSMSIQSAMVLEAQLFFPSWKNLKDRKPIDAMHTAGLGGICCQNTFAPRAAGYLRPVTHSNSSHTTNSVGAVLAFLRNRETQDQLRLTEQQRLSISNILDDRSPIEFVDRIRAMLSGDQFRDLQQLSRLEGDQCRGLYGSLIDGELSTVLQLTEAQKLEVEAAAKRLRQELVSIEANSEQAHGDRMLNCLTPTQQIEIRSRMGQPVGWRG